MLTGSLRRRDILRILFLPNQEKCLAWSSFNWFWNDVNNTLARSAGLHLTCSVAYLKGKFVLIDSVIFPGIPKPMAKDFWKSTLKFK